MNHRAPLESQILTLQVGPYSNFIASHYWNIQNDNYQYSIKNNSKFEVNPSILYRGGSGETANDSQTYTPRVLVVDYADNFGAMSREGRIYRPKMSAAGLPATTAVSEDLGERVTQHISKPAGSPISFDSDKDHRLDDFEYWSDYLQTDYHTNSIVPLTQTNQNNSISGKLYDDGYDLFFDNVEIVDTYQDNMRRLVEECDHLGGFQCFSDVDGIWGGVSTALLQHIEDEYTSRPIITFGCTQHSTSIADQVEASIDERVYNVSKSIKSLAQYSSLYTPLTAQRWSGVTTTSFNRLKMNNKFQTSAILASSIDTGTLYYRSNFNHSIADLCRHMSLGGPRNLCTLSSSFPGSIAEFSFAARPLYTANQQNTTNTSAQPLHSHPLMNYLSPKIINKSFSPFTEVISMRGEVCPGVSGYDQVKEVLEQYMSDSNRGNEYHSRAINSMICNISQPFIVDKPHSFPAYRSTSTNQSSNSNNNMEQQQQQHYDPTPTSILAHLQNGRLVQQYVKTLAMEFKELIQQRRVHRNNNTSDEADPNSATLEHLLNISDAYSTSD
ncbi:hypothetical protein SAMD00019534_116070 [Acytostelium subglobosum LB1]|uniref:hypothetical protein n=1 Tax=Acytostelium subglobosum LB1 TaxID=1410327 RepID=UPI000644D640|nr:hypothetical protein SAMD00019534_116070 [Acytostelium subglobosum LB1]GAM28431.1 hypothetical protein SAMD00019534_116070 [Acytostelium subglobosum LB1]|eukprot:XP_012748748.1 hypothetical protein SAMD00019534_116070 [Acytostelium subglobosum LB1]